MQINRMFNNNTYHLEDFNLGGGFLGIKNKARIGCISQSAVKKTISII